MYLDSDYIFFLWQIFHQRQTNILDKRFLEEVWKTEDTWVCKSFDDWSHKYNKTEIFRHFLQGSLFIWLIKEVYISIRKIVVSEYWIPDLVEVEQIKVDKAILNDYFETMSETRITGLNEKLKLFYLWFYSFPNNQWKYDYSVYYIYQADFEKIENYISEYILRWKSNQLVKPRNYISSDIQISDFVLIMKEYQKLYGDSFEYYIWSNPRIDEPTLIIYLQLMSWITIKEFDKWFCELLSQQKRIKFYIQLTEEFNDLMNPEKAPVVNNKIIKEVWPNYFLTFSWKRIPMKWVWLRVIKLFHRKSINSVKVIMEDIVSPSEDAFKRMIGRLNEELKWYQLRIGKIRKRDEYEIEELGHL